MKRLGIILLHLLTAALALLSILPFAWMACAAFKRGPDLFDSLFLPWGHLERLTGENFITLFERHPFGLWLLNSLFLTSTHTVLVVLLSSLGGFALAKYEFAGKKILTGLMLATMLVPGQVLLPGSYELMFHLGWINSFAAILVPGAVNVFGLLLFRGAMRQIPDELLAAARVDGCGELRLWWGIALPISKPMIGAFTLMSFLGSWNSFLWPQLVLQDESRYPLAIGMANLLGLPEYRGDYGLLMAATLISILPVAAVFFLLQRHFVSGLTSGAMKG